MQVVSLSARDPKCGVAAYTDVFEKELKKIVTLYPRALPHQATRGTWKKIADEINRTADLVHIQYHPDLCGDWRSPKKVHAFRYFLRQIKKPRIVTVHDLFLRPPLKPWGGMNVRRLIYNVFIVPFINHTPYGKFLLGGFLKSADFLIVHSHHLKLFLKSLEVRQEQMTVLYPGIPEITGTDPSILDRLQCRNRRLMTVFGFITPEKGYETVLKAMKPLPQDVILVIAGDIRIESQRSYLNKLKELISDLGLKDRVIFTQFLTPSEISSVLRLSELILLPYKETLASGVSYALSFALAAGQPIIASSTIYFREMENNFGILRTFPAGDFDYLTKMLAVFFSRPEVSDLQKTTVREFTKEWNWQKVADKTIQMYQKIAVPKSANAKGNFHGA